MNIYIFSGNENKNKILTLQTCMCIFTIIVYTVIICVKFMAIHDNNKIIIADYRVYLVLLVQWNLNYWNHLGPEI